MAGFHRALEIVAVLALCAAAGCASNSGEQSQAQGPQNSGQDRRPDVTDVGAEEIVRVLDDPSDELDFQRRAAALLAGVERDPELLQLVESRAVSAMDPRVREQCVLALGRYRSYSSIEALKRAAADPDPEVRAAAMWALGEINDPETAPMIAAGLDDADPRVRAAALAALATFPPEILTPAAAGRRPGLDFLLDWPEQAEARPIELIYVDATSGKDSNPGTAERPLKTMQAAVDRITPDACFTIYASSGERRAAFEETVSIGPEASGSADCPTRISAWPGRPEPVILAAGFHPYSELTRPASGPGLELVLKERPLRVLADAAGGPVEIPLMDGPSEDESCAWYAGGVLRIVGEVGKGLWISVLEDGIRVRDAPHVVIQGFTIRFAADSGIDFQNSPHCTCVDCKVFAAGRHGVFFYYSSDGLVLRSEIRRCGYQGISIRSSPDALIADIISADNGVDGVLFLYDSDRGIVADSLITGNSRGVGAHQGSNDIRIVNCVLEPNQGPSFRADESSSGQVIGP